jgi:hypothetical protein
MHAAVNEVTKFAKPDHSLRFIRSGADTMPRILAIDMEATFGCNVVCTYSMTERMPISVPPSNLNTTTEKSNSVG